MLVANGTCCLLLPPRPSLTEGDSFLIAFELPSHALAFAAACQLELLRAPWPEELLAHPDGCAVELEQTGESTAQLGSAGQCALCAAGHASQGPSLARWMPFCRSPRLARLAAKLLRLPEPGLPKQQGLTASPSERGGASSAGARGYQADSIGYSTAWPSSLHADRLTEGADWESSGGEATPGRSSLGSSTQKRNPAVSLGLAIEDQEQTGRTTQSSAGDSVSVSVFRRGAGDTVIIWGKSLSSMFSPASSLSFGRSSQGPLQRAASSKVGREGLVGLP